ncbi:PLP-dependent aminotransferase family protein [Xanthomonas arboricola]|uniref:aminotransferase-like domain-containing protein n=1 Tax=Xanthomonas arboricola TaxID=56448 RepID=UPI001C63F704|nr:PLP-dependent aminotransferase family protein [Xanthomonas arboricola]
MFLQLYWRYRNAIAQGGLRPGNRVPSVRSLASEVGVARGTVEKAYELLVSEGYLLTRGPAGTVVSPMAGSVGAGRRQRHPPPRAAPSLDTSSAGVLSRPFQLGVPAFDAFPCKVWKRLAGRHLRSLETAAMGYPEAAGYEPLRRAIANYLVSARGVACTYEQVFVTAGYPGALDLICRTLLKTGDVGWYEDPGYLFARQFLQRSGMQLQPVSVDEEGLNVGEGLKQNPAARFAVVTPAHQSPTGVALSLPRRLQLLDWASQANGWVIEDDYDSEFRYHGRPLPALGSLDDNDRVLYTGSFSKVLFPGLRLAYLVVPKHRPNVSPMQPGSLAAWDPSCHRPRSPSSWSKGTSPVTCAGCARSTVSGAAIWSMRSAISLAPAWRSSPRQADSRCWPTPAPGKAMRCWRRPPKHTDCHSRH